MTGCSCHAGTLAGRCAYCGEPRPRRARARAELGAVDASTRGTAVERINNAIVGLDFAARLSPAISPGVKQALGQLADHWLRYYRAGAYWTLPDPVWFAKLGRYVEWYARAYALVPPDVRSSAPAPDQIDPQFAELVHATITRVIEANASASVAAAQLVKETAGGLFDFGLLWLALGGLAIWKIYASAPRAPQAEDG